MTADLVLAEGAPGPTLVLHRDTVPPGRLAARADLTAVTDWLARTGRGHIRKLALYGPPADPTRHDLDYRFVQCLPDGFDFRAGCGHSLLACVAAAGGTGPVRVRAVTTGDPVRCEPEPDGAYTVRLLRSAPFTGLLPTGRPLDRLCGVRASLVHYGNPYVLVSAADLGVPTAAELHTAGDAVLARLRAIRAAAARLLGLRAGGALPKVAAVAPHGPGALAVRAVTVPSWHPGLALTGALCLAAAAAVPGTLPELLAGPATGPRPAGRLLLRLVTPGGTVTASAAADHGRLRDAGVHGKRVRVLERGLPVPWRIHVTA
ncbi:PrpF domain-containing protein [Streptomyces sp. NPDC058000]|uniref:PrpF domain-containing protein n=1 Tax=Streptomyces sp. NPDC058000 TaxID=3346299 RepID=UPI0036DFAB83